MTLADDLWELWARDDEPPVLRQGDDSEEAFLRVHARRLRAEAEALERRADHLRRRAAGQHGTEGHDAR